MKRTIALVLIVAFLAPSVALAVDGEKAAYVGGTISAFAGAKEPPEGKLDTGNAEALILTLDKKPFKDQAIRIPYAKVDDLEYGQKAGRRVGLAVGLALINPLGLLSLFSKKRNHFLTIAYKDEADQDQVVVLELGKDIVRTTLPVVETRSKKQIVYQDEEAAKGVR